MTLVDIGRRFHRPPEHGRPEMTAKPHLQSLGGGRRSFERRWLIDIVIDFRKPRSMHNGGGAN